MSLDLHLPLDIALTKLFEQRGKLLGVPERFAAVQYSNKGAQFQCNGALAAAKALKKNPRQIATEWIASFTEEERALFSTLEIAGPGFINISITDQVLAQRLETTAADERLSVPRLETPRKTYIDFGGYNVAKQLHIGHLRSTIIGDTLQRVFRFMGDDVISDVHLGDWGTQMGMLIDAIQEEQPELPYFDPSVESGFPTEPPITLEDMNRLYPAASARSKEEPEVRARASQATAELQRGRAGYRALWRHFVDLSILEVKADISPFNVHFDLWLGESDAQPLIPDLVRSLETAKRAEMSEGALILPIVDTKGEPMVPVMLRKRDGGATYHTSDLATIKQRADEGAQVILYVVDARQEMHFKQVFAGALQGKIVPEELRLEHIKFGTINGEDGRPFKTRSGDTVKLRDVVELAIEAASKRLSEGGLLSNADDQTRASVARAVAIAAIKFGDLSNHRSSDYILKMDDFCAFEGKTGPYLLYAAVRIKSIIAKAMDRSITAGPIQLTCSADRALGLALTRFPLILNQVHDKRTPHLLCEYLFELSQAFSSFYQQCNIVRQADPNIQAGWLSLVELCLRTLNLGLDLLGIEVPERM